MEQRAQDDLQIEVSRCDWGDGWQRVERLSRQWLRKIGRGHSAGPGARSSGQGQLTLGGGLAEVVAQGHLVSALLHFQERILSRVHIHSLWVLIIL